MSDDFHKTVTVIASFIMITSAIALLIDLIIEFFEKDN